MDNSYGAHIDIAKFNSINNANQRVIRIIENWLRESHLSLLSITGNLSVQEAQRIKLRSSDKRMILTEHLKSIWLVKSAGLEEFEQRTFEFVAMRRSDIRAYIQDMPYTPCFIANIIASVLYSVFHELDTLKNELSRCNTYEKVELTYIPSWLYEAIISIYSGAPEYMISREYKRMQTYCLERDDPHRKDCPVCALLAKES